MCGIEILIDESGQFNKTLLSLLCVEGPDMKFKGVLHPLIISPARVKELFEVTQTPQGGYPPFDVQRQ